MNNYLFLSEAITHALGWTLLHALWQGVLLAFIFAIVLKRTTVARTRYISGLLVMGGMVLAAVGTFIWVYEPTEDTTGWGTVLAAANPVAGSPVAAITGAAGFWESATHWLETRHIWLVGLWLAGFVVFLLRLLGGLWHLHRIRRAAQPADAVWLAQFHALAEKIAHSRPVDLLISAAIKTPIAIGWLRPAILLPIGMLTQLTPAEVHAILAHELAHLRRHDWIVNLAQALVETVFYFHPAIWWISVQVRIDREKCCDELALRLLDGNRLIYARALLHVQEFAQKQKHHTAPQLALSAQGIGHRPLLLERIQIILLQTPHTTFSQQKSMLMERMFMATLLAVALVFCGLHASNLPMHLPTAAAQLLGFEDAPTAILVNDTLPPAETGQKSRNRQSIFIDSDNKKVKLERVDQQITHLEIDGKVIPPSEYAQHQQTIDQVMAEIPPPPPPPARPPYPGFAPPAPPAARGGFFAPPSPPDAPDDMRAPAPPSPPQPPEPPGFFWSNDNSGAHFFNLNDSRGTGNSISIGSDKNWTISVESGGKNNVIVMKDGAITVNGRPSNPQEIAEQYDVQIAQAFPFNNRQLQFSQGGSFAGFPEGDLQRLGQLNEAQIVLDQQGMNNLEQLHALGADQKLGLLKGNLYYQNGFEDALVSGLYADGLIKDFENYSVELSDKYLKVGGKKQSTALFERYSALYRDYYGKSLGKKDKFTMEKNSSSSTTISKD